jgi:magnesium-protoporphyrin O-methyltransferase
MSCCGSLCVAAARHFDDAAAERDLDRYRRSGPDLTTRLLLASLRGSATPVESLLDVGGGIGIVSLEMLAAGVRSATLVEASPSYVRKAGEEARRRNVSGRLSLVVGDFVGLAHDLECAEFVVLDRVVCCYPDYAALLEKAMSRCRGRLALSYPRDRVWVRVLFWIENAIRRLKQDEFRTFVHSSAEVERILEAGGFRRRRRGGNWLWSAEVYERPQAP